MPEQKTLDRLLSRAEQDFDGPAATQALWDRRTALIAEHGQAIGYELVLAGTDEAAWSKFLGVDLPKLGSYLETKHQGWLGGPAVLIGLWSQDRIYLFTAPRLFDAVAELAALSRADLERMIKAANQPGPASFVSPRAPPQLQLGPPKADGED